MSWERKVTRLREYDYRQNGAYAVTICTYQRRCAFGRIENGVMRLYPFGLIAQERWLAIPFHRPNVQLDEFVIMPNHVHGILFIEDEAPPTLEAELTLRQFAKPQSSSLSTIIGSYKSGVTKLIAQQRGSHTRVWQERFYDHVIRHDLDLTRQREYIQSNPAKWADDALNPRFS
jgi:putative transposase